MPEILSARRILILGCPCAGKSTLARRLGGLTGLPVVHLDRLYWRPGWVEAEKREWEAQLSEELAKPEWILDGNYGGTIALRLARAEAVILLDFPRRVCLRRMAERVLRGWGRIRPDMGEGCPEKFDWEFARYIWNFRRTKLPALWEHLSAFPGEKVTLRRVEEIDTFCASITGAESCTQRRQSRQERKP